MGKKIYLSHEEQEVFEIIRDSTISLLGIEQLKDIFPKKNVNKISSSLAEKGYLHRIKRGLYLIQKIPSEKPLIEDPYLIAQQLYLGYLGFSTALKLYGLIEYEPYTIFLVTDYKSETLKLGEYTFKIINMTRRAEGMAKINNYTPSNLEKTFFDCFYKQDYAGGYSLITKALYESRKLNWNLFLYYFKEYASSSLCQKTGYILESMKNNTDFDIPEHVINYLKSRIKAKNKLLPKGKGRYIKAWKLMDNCQEMLGWYNG